MTLTRSRLSALPSRLAEPGPSRRREPSRLIQPSAQSLQGSACVYACMRACVRRSGRLSGVRYGSGSNALVDQVAEELKTALEGLSEFDHGFEFAGALDAVT